MKIAEIITILENRLTSLATAREAAVAGGDLGTVSVLDADLLETQASLDQLKQVPSA